MSMYVHRAEDFKARSMLLPLLFYPVSTQWVKMISEPHFEPHYEPHCDLHYEPHYELHYELHCKPHYMKFNDN